MNVFFHIYLQPFTDFKARNFVTIYLTVAWCSLELQATGKYTGNYILNELFNFEYLMIKDRFKQSIDPYMIKFTISYQNDFRLQLWIIDTDSNKILLKIYTILQLRTLYYSCVIWYNIILHIYEKDHDMLTKFSLKNSTFHLVMTKQMLSN